jgi:hypothetical protein
MKRNIVYLFIILIAIGFAFPLHGEGIYITTTEDYVEGSLRAAINTANGNSQDDTIYLPSGTYFLSGPADEDLNGGGDLDIDNPDNITIMGDGSVSTIIDGSGNDRVFHIINGTVVISGVTFQNGKTSDASFINAKGSPGGGIYNTGTLTLTSCIVRNNITGNGGTYSSEFLEDPEGGNGGCGGGISNEGTLTLSKCTLTGNKTGVGGLYYFFGGQGGAAGGYGGGVYNSGTLSISQSHIDSNTTGDGIEAAIHGGCGGKGGGIFNSPTGEAWLIDSGVENNTTGNGAPSGFYGGDGGNGGGICNRGSFIITRCLAANNITGDAGQGEELSYGGGAGGGICNDASYWFPSTLNISSSTISSNKTGNGAPPSDSPYSSWLGSCGGSGGGIYNGYNGTLSIINCTVFNNSTGSAGGGFPVHDGHGGGIWNSTSTPDPIVNIKNTIVAGNQTNNGEGPDCWGDLISQGYNLIQDTTDCTINGDLTGNLTGVAPLLGDLADNGGYTKTHALLPGSPAIDAGSSTGIYFDQRGYFVPMDIAEIVNTDDGADIGAYEYLSVIPPTISLNRTQLFFACISGSAAQSQSFFISKTGSGTMNWTVTVDRDWLSCSPEFGINSGKVTVTVDATELDAGSYTGTVTITAPSTIGSPQTVAVSLTVYTPGTTSLPFGVFSTPVEGVTVSSSIPVTGWVLDDIGVESVKIYRGETGSLTYIGDAVFVEGARPDVEQAYPDYPMNYQAGWGYMMLTNFLPNGGNGIFKIHAIATDMEGNQLTLGIKTITVDNANAVKPFGTIDTPAQGGTASGSSFVNCGWALTPQPNYIPTDGSTLNVFIDSVYIGHPIYNNYRGDIATLFPGYANSNGAIGHFSLDTTAYNNGIHTIFWIATDSGGNADGIGSRYFTIQNRGSSNSRSQIAGHTQWQPIIKIEELSDLPVNYSEPIEIKKGYGKNIQPEIIQSDEENIFRIEIRELERMELQLSNVEAGYMLAGNRIHPLPLGSTIDTRNDIFSWIPGPGFYGNYILVFIVKDLDGELSKKEILVSIVPKFGKEVVENI